MRINTHTHGKRERKKAGDVERMQQHARNDPRAVCRASRRQSSQVRVRVTQKEEKEERTHAPTPGELLFSRSHVQLIFGLSHRSRACTHVLYACARLYGN
ncbi:hypothetical protein TSAR_004455 [Trichomalopsis sarcophagae]|uniref:Uncharacterized protein n=1 Tax=Trichomalopsis sarcophagae TaxID=543379 RepID=A0A232F8X0_9HYME|nr:hypothetical protein TSAR_004455 [Trichomalopsis sarcophagae]